MVERWRWGDVPAWKVMLVAILALINCPMYCCYNILYRMSLLPSEVHHSIDTSVCKKLQTGDGNGYLVFVLTFRGCGEITNSRHRVMQKWRRGRGGAYLGLNGQVTVSNPVVGVGLEQANSCLFGLRLGVDHEVTIL